VYVVHHAADYGVLLREQASGREIDWARQHDRFRWHLHHGKGLPSRAEQDQIGRSQRQRCSDQTREQGQFRNLLHVASPSLR
jgi:hypothetical protein